MTDSSIKTKGTNKKMVVLGILLLLVVGGLLVFEPITRNVVATNDLCSYCHVQLEYRSEVRLAYSKHHPAATEDGTVPDDQALCVDCHLSEGFVSSIYAWGHFASLTDLFGHFRYRTAERAGDWLPPRQAAAYRVRDRLFEYDSPTCRMCHIEEEIEPKRERGKNAHVKALEDKMTCIECHYNEKHRAVDLRDDAFVKIE